MIPGHMRLFLLLYMLPGHMYLYSYLSMIYVSGSPSLVFGYGL